VAKQVVKTSKAADVLLKDSWSRDVRGEGKGEGRRKGFIGHLLACGLQIYRCWVEEGSSGWGNRAVHSE